MAEKLGHEGEPEFRLGRDEVHSWIMNILTVNNGDVIESDGESAEALEFAKSIEAEQSKRGYARNDIIADAVSGIDIDEIYRKVRERNEEGLAELSEGLTFYGDVQAVILNDEGHDEAIDVKGISLIEPDSYKIGIVDGHGKTHDYSKMRALLVPKEDEDE